MRLLLLLGIIMPFTLMAQPADTTNIKVADFEDANLQAWKFTNPSTMGKGADPGYVFSIVREPAHAGGQVAVLTNPVKGVWSQIARRIGFHSPDTLSKQRLTASIKYTGTSGEAGIAVRLFSKGKTLGLFERNTSSDSGWTKLSVDFLVNNLVDSLAIFCTIKGSGSAMFDDLALSKITGAEIQQTAEARIYLDTAFNIISRNAYYKDSVDFDGLIRYANIIASDARTPADCYPAINYVVTGLEDRHSHFYTAAQGAFMQRSSDSTMDLPTGKRLGNIGYIKVPKCTGVNPDLEKIYADSLLRVIRAVDHRGLTGWVIDNRDNTGGNSYPMLLGLGPILGNGVFQRTIRKGVVVDSAYYKDGLIVYADSFVSRPENPYKLIRPNPKVAVLMNGMCASSGESVLLSFVGRPATRSFGEPSYGLTTGNGDFTLSDGAMLLICGGKMSDRSGREYGGKIYPDVTVIDKEATKEDEVLGAALKWLKSN